MKDGQRASSVRTSLSSSKSPSASQEEWRQVQKELEGVGITPTQFNDNRDKIVGMLKDAFEEDLDDEYLAVPSYKATRISRLLSSISGRNNKILIAVVEGDSIQKAKGALQKGADVNTRDSNGLTPLCLAVKAKNVEMVKLFLAYGADVNKSSNLTEMSPLTYAIQHGCIELVDLLLDHGAFFNYRDGEGRIPLHLAIERQDLLTVNTLLYRGADVHTHSNRSVSTALGIAIERKSIDIVKTLVRHGSDIEQLVSIKNPKTPLVFAIENGMLATTKFLLDNGANVNGVLCGGGVSLERSRPLYIAIQCGHLDLVKLLINHGADPGVTSRGENTLLLLAISKRELEITKVMLESDKVEIEFGTANPEILVKAVESQYTEMIKYLLSRGFSNTINESTLLAAMSRKIIEHLQLLLDCQPAVDLSCLLDRAFKIGSLALIRLLFERGAVLRSDQKGPLLFESVRMGAYDVTKLLIDQGADVNVRDREILEDPEALGKTPVWLASEAGSLRILYLLLENHADIETRASPLKSCKRHEAAKCLFADRKISSCTAVQIAMAHGHQGCVRPLVRKGGDLDAWVEYIGLRRGSNISPKDEYLADFQTKLLHLVLSKPKAQRNSPDSLDSTARMERLRFLMEIGANIHVEDDNGQNALHIIAMNQLNGNDENLRLAKILIAKGAKLNVQDSQGRTPLHIAASTRSPNHELIELFLKSGADPNARDQIHDSTPLHYAGIYHDKKMFRTLVQAGGDPKLKDIGASMAQDLYDNPKAVQRRPIVES